MFRRPVVLGGVAVAGAAGYYLYTAGGDPKVAEKRLQSASRSPTAPERETRLTTRPKGDAASASAAIKARLPGGADDARAQAKLSAEQAGRKIDDAVSPLPLSVPACEC